MAVKISANAYSKHRGVSGNAVKKAIQEGRITAFRNAKGQYEIDPEVADRQWAENTMTPEKRAAQKKEFIEIEKEEESESPDEDWEIEQRLKIDPDAGLSLAEARRLRENYKAKQAKTKYEEEIGRLISAEKVRADAFKMSRMVRDQFMSLPDRISGELASMTDSKGIANKLSDEIRSCLEALSKYE